MGAANLNLLITENLITSRNCLDTQSIIYFLEFYFNKKTY